MSCICFKLNTDNKQFYLYSNMFCLSTINKWQREIFFYGFNLRDRNKTTGLRRQIFYFRMSINENGSALWCNPLGFNKKATVGFVAFLRGINTWMQHIYSRVSIQIMFSFFFPRWCLLWVMVNFSCAFNSLPEVVD